jgi:ferritin-like metal-binding protein YciE
MNFAICTARKNQLVKALPKLAKGAIYPKLKQLFSAHLEETKVQVERLKTVFLELGESRPASIATEWKG